MAGGTLAEASVQVTADTRRLPGAIVAGVRRAGRGAESEADNVGLRISNGILSGMRGLRDSIGQSVTRALRTLKGVLAGIGASVAAAGVASLAANLTSLAAAAAPAAGAVAAIPTAAAAASAAVGTLAVALSGVGDAFEEALTGSAEDFKESLEGLSGPVRQVATSLRQLRPRLTEIRNSVQAGLFAPLVGELDQLTQQLGGPVQTGMTETARQMGLMAREASNFATQSESVEALQVVFDLVRDSLEQLRPAIQPVLAGLRDLAVAVVPAFRGMSTEIADAATEFGQWLSAAAESGQALQWVQDAETALSNMADVAGNVAGTVSAIFDAATEGGANALASLSVVTAEMEQFARSAEGQEALSNIFEALRDVADALVPVITAVVSQLGELAPVIGDIAQSAGPGLVAVVEGIGQALQAAGPGLQQFTSALSDALSSLSQSGALEDIGAAFGEILAAVTPLLGPLSRVAATLGQAIADTASAAAPVIDAIATGLGRLLDFIRPLTPGLLALVAPFGGMVRIATGLLRILRPLVLAVGRFSAWIGRLIPSFQQIVGAGRAVVQFFARFGQRVQGAIQTVRTVIMGVFRRVFTQLPQRIGSWASGVFGFFRRLPGRIWNFISSIPGRVRRAFRNALSSAGSSLPGWASALFGFFRRLPGRIWNFISSIPGRVRRAFRNAVTSVGNRLGQWASSIMRWFRNLPDRVKGALGGLTASLTQPFREAFDSVKRVVSNAIDTILGWISDAWDRISGTIGRIKDAISSIPDRIPGLADGGIVTSPTLANLGENSRPEVVIPLSKPNRARELARESGLLDLLDTTGVNRPQPRQPGGGTSHRQPVLRERVVNAPITVHAQHADGEDVARRVQTRLYRMAGSY